MNDVLDTLTWLPKPWEITLNEVSRAMLKHAYDYANENSPDPSTKNGAILVRQDGYVLAHGVNKFPEGVAETEERLRDKATKYRLVVHAENGAIFNAARSGQQTYGSTLYCPFYACSECAKAIIQGGIKRVVGHAQIMALASEHTVWVKSIQDAWDMLHESGVKCELFTGRIGIKTRFNGKDILV